MEVAALLDHVCPLRAFVQLGTKSGFFPIGVSLDAEMSDDRNDPTKLVLRTYYRDPSKTITANDEERGAYARIVAWEDIEPRGGRENVKVYGDHSDEVKRFIAEFFTYGLWQPLRNAK
jgi:hypothetical protein